MKIIITLLIIFNFIIAYSFAEEKRDCSNIEKFVDRVKCKAANLKPNKFIKDTIEYQKKAFEKKEYSKWILKI